MRDAKTAKAITHAPGAGLPGAERETDPVAQGQACPEACRTCPQACSESALIGHAVIQSRCRRRPAVQAASLFTLPGCPLCRECRENLPAAPATAPAAWRKGFRG